ncbi:MAG: dihydrodipicolinate synthase family protein [Planctomyces sp.]|nr:dihydrodipicolinate synthase family protein [Planctomyces sp.]
MQSQTTSLRNRLLEGHVIPACPLALNPDRSWSEKHQRALIRYYLAAGAGGVAVGVHSTQFAIRRPEIGLFRPVLELVASEFNTASNRDSIIRIAGICGRTRQACEEASLASQLGYETGLLSLAAFQTDADDVILEHCRSVSEIIPLTGFYLQPSVGGRILSYAFWRAFTDIPNVVAIKVAPFNRYQTIDVIRAVMDSGRKDIAIYTGNDDNIIVDLLTPFSLSSANRHKSASVFIAGGLLGQWGVWTQKAVQMLSDIKHARTLPELNSHWLRTNAALTEANAAIFDSANHFAGCIPGILAVLHQQRLVPSVNCLDPQESLSPGQAQEIDRIIRCYPELTDIEFVEQHRDQWLR